MVVIQVDPLSWIFCNIQIWESAFNWQPHYLVWFLSHDNCHLQPSALFFNSLTSVRVFTGMVSDNPWCSLWVPSSQSRSSNIMNITTIFWCLHIHERTSLTKQSQIFKKFTLKFNKLLKSATTDQSAASLLGLCTVYKAWWWRSQVFTSWCGKIQTDFFFSKIAVFLMYMEIYVHVFAIIKQPT